MQQNEKNFRRIFEHHDAVMLLIDPAANGSIVSANKAASKFYGYSQDELTGMLISEINQLSPEEIKQRMKEAYEEENNCFIFPHRLANGEIRRVEVHSSPINIDNRQFLFSIIHDVTQREEAKEKLHLAHVELEERVEKRTLELSIANMELATERKRLLGILEAIPGYICLLAKDYSIVYANKYFKSRFGETAKRLCHKILWDRDEPCDKCAAFKIFDTGEPQTWELNKASDGSIYNVYGYPFEDFDGKEYILEMGIDITALKHTEEKLKEYQYELEEKVRERTDRLQQVVNLMAGREIRMAELKEVIEKLRKQLEEAEMTPVADDPLKEGLKRD